MNPQLKATPLYSWHAGHRAQMAEFGGYRMPLWCSSAKDEHIAVLTRAGLLDTSHMTALIIEGEAARSLLQACFSRDLEACIGPERSPLCDGRLVYGVFLDARGHVIDDAIAYQIGPGKYMLVINAGMGGRMAGRLSSQAPGSGVSVSDLSGKLGTIDLQGPASARIRTSGVGRSCTTRGPSACPGTRPDGFQPKGLCCGFALVDRPVDSGAEIQLQDARRTLRPAVSQDIRPDRTARAPLRSMLSYYVSKMLSPFLAIGAISFKAYQVRI